MVMEGGDIMTDEEKKVLFTHTKLYRLQVSWKGTHPQEQFGLLRRDLLEEQIRSALRQAWDGTDFSHELVLLREEDESETLQTPQEHLETLMDDSVQIVQEMLVEDTDLAANVERMTLLATGFTVGDMLTFEQDESKESKYWDTYGLIQQKLLAQAADRNYHPHVPDHDCTLVDAK
jgi:hypothetical protein